MVITSTTQWNIPLSGGSLSASSPPASSRQSSMLGLKTCQLSAPQHAMNSSEPRRHSHHQDLHSTSSRRLQGAENVISRRSAGSFRQLVPDEFFAKLGHGARRPPVSHEIGRDKEFERKYEGIAMPWGTSSLPALDMGTATGTALPGNLIDVHGDITADDVDLLPLPGLLSCSSHFTTAPTYVCHIESPKNSRNVESASSESTGKISKASLIVPDYLGLPPELDTDVIAENRASGWSCLVDKDASVLQSPPIINEYAGGAGTAVSSAGRAHNGKDVDSFTDSLAGLWSIPAGADYMLQDSESLASIFNIYPQNFHSFSSAEQSLFDMRNTETAQPIMDDLHCFMNFSSDCCEEKGTGCDALHGFSPGRPTYSVNEYRNSKVLESDPAHANPSVVASHSNASELKGSVPASASDGSVVSYASSLSHSRSYAESPLKLIGESISLKRPFSALDLASMASSATSTGSCITGANAWFSSSKGMGTEVHEELLKRVAPILSESQNDLKLDGNVHYLPTVKGNGSTGEMSPKPPPTKIRRKHGTAMDPQSVAARTRREKFSDRIRILQTLVPNGERLDTVSMLSQTLEYVKFLQHQVWHLYHGKDPTSDTDTCEKWRDFVEAEPAPAN